MLSTETKTATLDRPQGVRFSLRSVLVAMTVLAVVAAVLGPWIRSLTIDQQISVACVLGFSLIALSLGAVFGSVLNRNWFRGGSVVSFYVSHTQKQLFTRLAFWALVLFGLLLLAATVFELWMTTYTNLSRTVPSFPFFFSFAFYGKMVSDFVSFSSRVYFCKQGVYFPHHFLYWFEAEGLHVSRSRISLKQKFTTLTLDIDVRRERLPFEFVQRIQSLLTENNIPYTTDEA